MIFAKLTATQNRLTDHYQLPPGILAEGHSAGGDTGTGRDGGGTLPRPPKAANRRAPNSRGEVKVKKCWWWRWINGGQKEVE